MSISSMNLNAQNYNAQKNLSLKQKISFKAQKSQQSLSKENSFYKKHKQGIWGLVGAFITALTATALFKKTFVNASFFKKVAITLPSGMVGALGGSYLSKTQDKIDKKDLKLYNKFSP